ncbi:DNA polymerase I [Coxiella endosymbiont of Ornithodoros amblus]|uniref:DNA polymerase I n=1 Tax=Coxiella endosymbiont of Ornithodoros amblus TaxID=1656166 RepID=UPI00244DCE03|nr:DNA polymerase I [Coxiella endosymbiont of Ornithodoros amblus]MBW5802910.1 DNA polymerase I [Coxiella endosymbiont of Ornithodoros amblus]
MTALSSKPLILIDGSSYLFRAYYALPPLTNRKGQPTGAMYGVINMLRKLMVAYQPDYVAVVFDPKGKTFRHDLHHTYKANRVEMPNELRSQIKPLFEIIRALGFPLIIREGYEADDVIATLAKKAKEKGMPVLVSTGDKDLAQIVNEHVTLVNTMKDQLLNSKGVLEKFGVPPEKIIDYLTLTGDTTDNIPGVPKVGPKTAVKWLSQYDSVENIIKHAHEIKGKVGENLRACIDDLPLMRRLVTVISDLPLEENPTDLIQTEKNREKLIELFTKYEFKSWLAELLVNQDKKVAAFQYATITDKKTFEKWVKKLADAKVFAFDTEATDFNAIQAKLVGISFATSPYEAAYVPLEHDYTGAPAQLDKEEVLRELKPLLEDQNQTIIFQNLKYNGEVLAKEGITIRTKTYDTLLESYVLNSSSTRHDLNTLAFKYLGRMMMKFEDVAGKGMKQISFNHVTLDKATAYAAEDVDVAFQLHHKLMPLIEKEKNLKKVFEQIEMPLVPILMQMEMRGVLVDIAMLQAQSIELGGRIALLEQKAYKLVGREFNLSSPKQLQTILYEELKLPIFKKTPGGQPSTAENVLQDLALNYPLPKVILEHRSLTKLKTTYTDRLPVQVHLAGRRIHTSYNQTVTSTGRLSSNNPNLQNIPVRTEEGRKIRRAFIAPPGFQMVAADYSQVELRIIAHISKDPSLIRAFDKEWDIHRATAAEVLGVNLEQVTPEQRRRAKAINFGLLYGMSSFGLARQLGIGRDLAQEYIDIYFKRYPKVHEYMQKIRIIAFTQGYVETLFGRRVYLPDIHASNMQHRRAAERAAINAPMQGTAADIIKIAMIKVSDWLQKTPVEAHLIMQVHDELVFEVAEKDLEKVIPQIKKSMEEAVALSVPLMVDVGAGGNWDESH